MVFISNDLYDEPVEAVLPFPFVVVQPIEVVSLTVKSGSYFTEFIEIDGSWETEEVVFEARLASIIVFKKICFSIKSVASFKIIHCNHKDFNHFVNGCISVRFWSLNHIIIVRRFDLVWYNKYWWIWNVLHSGFSSVTPLVPPEE